ITDDAGLFSFPEVPAGFNYTVTPVNNNVFTFAPQSTGQLLDNAVMSFTGARRSWSVSGVVRRNGSAIAGVTVELEGTGRKATTDSAGRYVINGVPAGLTYKVLPSSEDYAYDPGSLTIDSLQGDTVADFNVTHFLLHGRVTDPEGRGVFGVTVNLTGTLTATAFTRDDGTYSIPVHRTGNYTITPTKEQNFYAFAPEKARLTGLDGSRHGDFTATLNTSASPSYVLEYDGGQKTVDYGPFWPESIDLGHFFWEFWAMPGPGAGATYMLTDGYGGAHALLFGVSHLGTSEPGRYQFIGNIWDGQAVNFFYSDEGPAPNEWGHFAVGWDGAHIVTYFNGVPVGAVRHRGTRFTPGFAQGGGRLLIGGSDHNNFVGRIAQVRGYEGSNPRGAGGEPGETSVFSTFAPQTIFSVDGNLLSYFFKTAPVVGDYSKGFEGSPHPGARRGTVNGILFPCDGCPKPAFVVDKTAPNFATPDNPGQPAAPVRPAAPTPAGAIVFDSFQRSNSTLALGGTGGLGSTESGTAGPLAWKFDTNETPLPFGILNGRAVLLADRSSVAWVEPGAQPVGLDVSAARTRGTYGSGQNTGLSFRVADADNYFFAFTENDGDDLTGPKLLTVGYYLGGERTELTSEVEIPGNWRTLRVLTYNDGRIHVLADGLLIYSTTSGLLSSASGAGLYNDRA
ncbi:MAG TPA: carboxypeptidase regulatory-like domain-containing protein, partial [Pyrinomonadaceae bacterium]|nr:carboxypeptidase regulatory-like domain-containing protein [Pyrinomonadaceae bacterium]